MKFATRTRFTPLLTALSSTLFLANSLANSLAYAQAMATPSASPDSQTATAVPFKPAACVTGIYRMDGAQFVVLTKSDQGFSYTFSDGIVGKVQDSHALVECGQEALRVRGSQIWPQVPISIHNTRFASGGVMLAGRLMEAPGAGARTPLVVYAHGSEDGGWIDRAVDPYQMVGRGVSVFVYDKRGTGASEGRYTQNFPLLADDLVAAAQEAKRLAQGRYGRFGLFGLSQGGWIAPLAAARAGAEFLGIGYGLAVDIAEQDAAKVSKELRDRGYGDEVIAKAQRVTEVTAKLVKTGYRQGLAELAEVQQQYGKEVWFPFIQGGYSGVYLGMSVDQLRQHGMPFFDNLGVDWSQNPMQVLGQVRVPQLWALAEEDRSAPIGATVERLASLRQQGHDIAMYIFPATDHGMWNYRQTGDYARQTTRVTAGFYDLMADWAKHTVAGNYGTAYRR